MKSLFLMLGLALAILIDLRSGSTSVGWMEILKALASGPVHWDASNAVEVVWQLRLPRILTSILAGSALSVAGLQMQTLFRNPLAGPSELGLSAGAGLGVAGFVLMGWQGPAILNQAGLLGAAALGAAAVMLLLMVLAPILRSSTALLLAGLLISSALGACIAGLQAFSDAEALQSFVQWTLGSVSGITWNQLAFMAPICFLGMFTSILSAKSLKALMLGEDEARSLGARVSLARIAIASNASILAATVTAFCGPVAFIGLATPHVARWLMGRSDPRILTPIAASIGATLLLLCDALSQKLLPGRVLPINVVVSAFGAPMVLFLLLRFQKRAEV